MRTENTYAEIELDVLMHWAKENEHDYIVVAWENEHDPHDEPDLYKAECLEMGQAILEHQQDELPAGYQVIGIRQLTRHTHARSSAGLMALFNVRDNEKIITQTSSLLILGGIN